jgi:hypothetical protein
MSRHMNRFKHGVSKRNYIAVIQIFNLQASFRIRYGILSGV